MGHVNLPHLSLTYHPMHKFIHLNKFSPDLQNDLNSESYYDALLALFRLPESDFQQETIGDVFHEIDFFGLARKHWRKANNQSAALKTNVKPEGRTWIMVGPSLNLKANMPEAGSYSLFCLMPPAQGQKRGVRKSILQFYPGKGFRFHASPRIFLEYFMKEENFLINYSKNDLREGKNVAVKEAEWLKTIKQEIVRIIPTLAYCLWPDKMEFRLKWKEKPFAEKDKYYLEKTLNILAGNWLIGFESPWKLKFEPLKWDTEESEGQKIHKAKLTRSVAWKKLNEHIYRTYGHEEFTEGIWESGLWIEVKEEAGGSPEITLQMKRPAKEDIEPVSKMISLDLKVEDEKWLVFHFSTRKKIRTINMLRGYFNKYE